MQLSVPLSAAEAVRWLRSKVREYDLSDSISLQLRGDYLTVVVEAWGTSEIVMTHKKVGKKTVFSSEELSVLPHHRDHVRKAMTRIKSDIRSELC